MQIIWCLGGLGNQMFQYCFYRCLQLQGKNVLLDISELADYELHNGFELARVFKLAPRLATKAQVSSLRNNLLRKSLAKLGIYRSVISQREFYYNEKYLKYKLARYLIGYWQSPRYFAPFAAQICQDFSFPAMDFANQEVAAQIAASNSVAIHVRLGDYVNNPVHGGICTLDYYQKAIELIQERLVDPSFFIFSNDIAWCQANLKLKKAVFVDGNSGQNSYRDMQLMSLCRHNIIANSSFSWWGAWLNTNPQKIVIAPAKWFNDPTLDIRDLFPEDWLRVCLD